jgi:RecB family exonuclease
VGHPGHRQTLRRFYAEQQRRPESPTLLEEKFRFLLDDVLVVGRWDRVDQHGEEAVIIDYKSSAEVRDQAAADRRAGESLQLLIYALAWRTLKGRRPARVELRFLETGLIGSAQPTDTDLERATARIREAAHGVRAQRFPAQPKDSACRWCAFQAICPFAFQAS